MIIMEIILDHNGEKAEEGKAEVKEEKKVKVEQKKNQSCQQERSLISCGEEIIPEKSGTSWDLNPRPSII